MLARNGKQLRLVACSKIGGEIGMLASDRGPARRLCGAAQFDGPAGPACCKFRSCCQQPLRRTFISRKDAAGAILYAAEKATWMALEAIQALGGNGYINDYPTGRLLRDAKLYEIGAGTSEIRRMLIGRELFNETA